MSNMGNMSIFHWIVVLVVLFVYLFPIVMIIRKAGYNGWWVLVMFVPVVNVIMLWVFAFARWPRLTAS